MRYRVFEMKQRAEKSIEQAWRKSRIAARILRRADDGRLSIRDVRIGAALGDDPAVTPRLINQALNGFQLRDTRLANARRQAS